MGRVCIGVPVYNGEKFLASALQSMRDQTFKDFEVVILDNASTDNTEAISKDFVSRDSRFKYVKNEKNIGAPQNFNLAYAKSSAEYFKWAAHDDLLAPRYLEKCLKILDSDATIVLCHSNVTVIDDDGKPLEVYTSPLSKLDSDNPVHRFADFATAKHACFDVFGVIRNTALQKSGLIGSYFSADRVLLAELALHGPTYVIPDILFYSRDHSGRSVRIPIPQRVREWWSQDGHQKRFVFPYWRLLGEYLRAINRAASTSAVRFGCYKVTLKWSLNYWRHLASDLKVAAVEVWLIILGKR